MGWKTTGCVFQRRFQLGILIKKPPMMDEYFVAPRENPQTYVLVRLRFILTFRLAAALLSSVLRLCKKYLHCHGIVPSVNVYFQYVSSREQSRFASLSVASLCSQSHTALKCWFALSLALRAFLVLVLKKTSC